LEKIVYFFFLGAICLLICGFVTMATSPNENVTPDDTVIVPPAKETPTKPPVITPTPTKVEKPVTVVTPAPTPEPVPPIVVEDEFQQAKERQQQEQIEELNQQEQAEEPTEEQAPEPININAVVDQDGYVFVGVENAGRQVTITGV
jgi:type IV secretory pathway VirB10-like protein